MSFILSKGSESDIPSKEDRILENILFLSTVGSLKEYFFIQDPPLNPSVDIDTILGIRPKHFIRDSALSRSSSATVVITCIFTTGASKENFSCSDSSVDIGFKNSVQTSLTNSQIN